MRITMSSDIIGLDAENFVIKLLDAIKCASASNNALDIKLNKEEVCALGEHIRKVNWIEINEE